jgi:hypothetical protein
MKSFQIAYYFVRRVPETEEPAVMAVYLKVLRERLVKMKAMVDEIFARLEAAHADDRTVYTVEGRDYAI